MLAFVALAFLVLFVVVIAVAGGGTAPEPPLPLSERSDRYRALPWSKAAAELGLLTRGDDEPRELTGELDGFAVRIWKDSESDSDGPDDDFTAFEVDASGALGIAHIRGDAGVTRFLLGEDFETGDAEFDDQIRLYVENPDLMRAVFDHETRARVAEFVTQHHGRMSSSVLRDDMDGHIDDATTLVEHARWLADLADRMNPSIDEIPTRLSHIAMGDPKEGVRLHALRTVKKLYPRAESTNDLLENLVRTAANDMVTAEAAYTLGADGVSKLRDVLTHANGKSARELALRGIVEHVDRDQAAELAIGGLSSGLRMASARALHRLGRSEDEEHLLPLLEDDDTEVQLAAVEALGALGTLAAVEPLLPLTKGILRSPGLKEAARTSVAAIQERHARGDAGAVAVVESPAAGGMTVAAEVEVGAVSEALEERVVDEE